MIKGFSKEELSRLGLLHIALKERSKINILRESKSISENKKQLIVKQWCQENNITREEELKNWLDENFLSKEEWLARITRKHLWCDWCLEKFKNKIENSFLKSKDSLEKVTYSLVRVKNKDLANELFFRIKEGEANFTDIATQFSEGLEKHSGGLVGPLTYAQIDPLLSKLLKVSAPNQLWPPKHIDGWWVVIKLNEKYKAILDEKVRLKIALELGDEYLKEDAKNNLY